MSQLSSVMESIEPSATIQIKDLALELRSQGEDIIDLSAGDPDISSSNQVNNAAKQALENGDTHYTSLNGTEKLRKAIAKKLRTENDLRASSDNIIVTPGAKQGIFEALYALIETGDEVAIFNPSWVSYEAIVRMAGGHITSIPLDPESGFRLNPEELYSNITDETKLILLNTPSNPTGAVFSKSELRKIRDLAIKHDVWVLADEIYEKIIYNAEHQSIGSLDGMSERTITVNGFSKAHAMTGWRLGYFVAPDELIEQAMKVHSHTVTCATSFAQAGGIAALEENDDFVTDLRNRFATRRKILLEELEEIGIEIPRPQGAFYVFIPVIDDDTQFAEDLLKNEGVATTPGSAFGVPGYIRLAYTTNEEQIREGVRSIGRQLSESP